jgi:hypothetical protein
MLRSTIPNFDQITTEASGNISDMLAGKLPSDVSAAVQNSSAAKSLGSGTAGSGFSKDLVARDLGLTSLDLTAKGLSSAESWFASTERMLAPAVSELSKMFITPMQEYSTTNEQNMQQFQRQWMVNQIGAMPDPEIRGWQDTFMQLSGRGGQPQSGGQYAAVGVSSNPYTNPYGSSENQDWGAYNNAAYGASTSGTTININGANGGAGVDTMGVSGADFSGFA